MNRTDSLRFRVAFLFAIFGAGLSILFSGGLYLAVQQMGDRLIDETLRAELDEHAYYPVFMSPNTSSIMGYALSITKSGEDVTAEEIPAEIRKLPPGTHNAAVGKSEYRVLVEDREGTRYFMMFDTKGQRIEEESFFRHVVIFALFLTISVTVGGLMLATRVTAPVVKLAEQVGHAEPDDADMSLVNLTRNDEVGDLARAFDRYLRRLREFIEREHYFTADVSHELRTPLAIMLGTVEVLEQDETLTPKQRERIARIHRAAQGMSEMTAALLVMARERQHAADETVWSCRVAEVVRASVDKHMHLTDGLPVRIEMELLADPVLLVDRPLLKIVIGNLIRNALFNTKSGTVLLRLEENRLIVRDTGIGMRPDELAHALDRYYKGASSTGAGVGLSLVKRICERYGWCISLDSREGEGTTAEIIFFAPKLMPLM